jgi:adenine-specific DNA-methyltransferase
MIYKKGKLELTWVGKEERIRLEPRVLVEDPEKSYGDPKSENMLIFGDNLLALKALEQDFAGKVKCIYIDPPYNTGSAFEHYADGLEHSIWLNLVRDRLEILWRLLSDDGSIWISIDDREMPYLRIVMDEICGRSAFLASNVWQKRYSRENREAIGDAHEYVIVYVKDKQAFKSIRNPIPLGDKQRKIYKNPNNDIRGQWRAVSLSAQGYRPNQMYEIVSPITGKRHRPPAGSCWKIIESKYRELLMDKRIYFGKDGNAVPGRIQFLKDIEGMAPWTWWPHEETGHTDEAKKEMHDIYGIEDAFGTPKPERLIQRIIHIASNPGDLVLDSFAGSGTTGAVAHKMGRRWIMCELGEHCNTHIIPRMKKVVDGTDQGGISESVNWNGGGGFKYFRLAESLLVRDKELSTKQSPVYIVNPRYNEQMLIKAICKIEGFRYRHDGRLHGISSESRFLHVTTRILTQAYIDSLAEDIAPTQSLMVYSTRRSRGLVVPDNIEIKKIPRDLLDKCDFEEDRK